MTERFAAPTIALALALTLLATAADAQPCTGDCNDDGDVTVDELITGVNIALDVQSLDACAGLDADHDGSVTIDELIAAVNVALLGCVRPPTVTETATPEATPTESATAEPTSSLTETSLPGATASSTPAPPFSPTPPATVEPSATTVPTAAARFCDLPGSVQTTDDGVVVVPGNLPPIAPDLRFLHLPSGFCVHFFAKVNNTRQLRFAPSGELFIASPTTFTTGNGRGGSASIVVLSDDDRDGIAENTNTFLSGLPSTQGMMFAGDSFYYQDDTRIMRLPYVRGDRTPGAAATLVADVTIHSSRLHWPKSMDIADDGSIYVANGSDQTEPCENPRPFRGGILELDGSPGGRPVAKGFRNPIAVRCTRGTNVCYAVELARDFTENQGGREKLIPIHDGDDWGFPCCAAKDLPYPDIRPVPDCSGVAVECSSFRVGFTPFDVDFETGKWPAAWSYRAYVPMHGVFGTWVGARVVAIEMDPMTGKVLLGSDVTGVSSGAMKDFITGWDDGTRSHGRPANVAFAADGRLFLSNDNNGVIAWIAPLDLAMP